MSTETIPLKEEKYSHPNSYGALNFQLGSLPPEKKGGEDSELTPETQSPPKKIILFLDAPPPSGEMNPNALYLEKESARPDTHIIYVNYYDFRSDGLLTFEAIQKLAILRKATSSTEINIIGHGKSEAPSENGIDLRRYLYGHLADGRMYGFSAVQLANILSLINDPSVRKDRNALNSMTKSDFYQNHLNISLSACTGEYFAKALFERLYENPNSLLISKIVASRKSTLLAFSNVGNYSFSYYINPDTEEKKGILGAVLTFTFLASVAGVVCGEHFKVPDLTVASIITLGVCLSLTAAITYVAITKGKELDNDQCVVIAPDLENLEATPAFVPYQAISEKAFQQQLTTHHPEPEENISLETVDKFQESSFPHEIRL